MNERFSIGEFSDLTGISKRMLRHYDKLNLFCPAEINEDNGYRYYLASQVDDLDKIQFLRTLGFSLSSIGDILSKPISVKDFLEILKDKEMLLNKESDEIKSSLLSTSRMISLLENQTSKMFPSVYKLLDWERSLQMTQNNHLELIKLSGLMNRDLFLEKIEEVMAEDLEATYYFLTFDIDHFMQVNQTSGYEVGDKVIQTTLSIVVDQVKPLIGNLEDAYVTRMGGDEFSVFVKNASEKEVESCVMGSIDGVREYDFEAIGCKVPVTISCGISVGKTPEHIIALKDASARALMDAKRYGKDKYLMTHL
ncbi:diguanylate cyclase [Acidaminobacter sp. JC074]|uniref:diguanylate cyclase domain-containing protein n=1 Tax=Acidaminobacter sp. JC074 TaxID=2530199 RepID=UPI001F0FC871|nr:diguanylate cyclase [Acidaminobacter sp. JC074]MCH4890070.1 diguanylate cyclase [Acidaminobacter sp. JC074]